MNRHRTTVALCCIAVSTSFAGGVHAQDAPPGALAGRMILERYCARCHAVDKTGDSPLQHARPLRELYRGYPIERLEFELAEGIGSRHADMPQVQFSSEEIDQIVAYLAHISRPD